MVVEASSAPRSQAAIMLVAMNSVETMASVPTTAMANAMKATNNLARVTHSANECKMKVTRNTPSPNVTSASQRTGGALEGIVIAAV